MRLLLLLLISFSVIAAQNAPIRLEDISVNLHNKQSIKRGAKYFAQNCMVCHTMKYLKHNELAANAGITLEKMPLKQKEWIYDVVPPDLTLVAKRYSPDWIYTYMHSFYKDPSRPTGFNNLLKPNTAMTNIFASLQGQQVLTVRGEKLLSQSDDYHYYSILKMVKSGQMTPEQFNQMALDLVNFFVYAANPNASLRVHIGLWVMLFLFVLLVLSALLKKSYWNKIDKS